MSKEGKRERVKRMAEGGVKERWKDSGETERCMWRKHGVPA